MDKIKFWKSMSPLQFFLIGIGISLFSLVTKRSFDPFSLLAFISMGIFEIFFRKQKRIPSNLLSFACGITLFLFIKLYIIDFKVMAKDSEAFNIPKNSRIFYRPSLFKLKLDDPVLYQPKGSSKLYLASLVGIKNNSYSVYIPFRKIEIVSKSQIKGKVIRIITPSERKEYDFFRKGESYFASGMYDKAIAEFTQAIKMNPNFTMAYFGRGVAYYNYGLKYKTKDNFDSNISSFNFNLAILDFNKAIEKFHNSFELYITRGACYADNGDIDKAISDYSKAIELNPNDPAGYNNRAELYFRNHEYDKAWEDVQKAETLGNKFEPDFIEALKRASGKKDVDHSLPSPKSKEQFILEEKWRKNVQ